MKVTVLRPKEGYTTIVNGWFSHCNYYLFEIVGSDLILTFCKTDYKERENRYIECKYGTTKVFKGSAKELLNICFDIVSTEIDMDELEIIKESNKKCEILVDKLNRI